MSVLSNIFEVDDFENITKKGSGIVSSTRWPRGQCAQRAIARVKQRSQRSVIGWVSKSLFSPAPPYFRRHVKPLVSAAFVVVNSHQSPLGPRGGLTIWVNHKEACAPAAKTLIY
jgi:hypothetical protein